MALLIASGHKGHFDVTMSCGPALSSTTQSRVPNKSSRF